MKKLKFIIPMLAIALLFTGCGKSPENVLKDASEKMKKLDNYHMTMKMDMELSYEGSSMTMAVKLDSDVDNKNGINVMETTSSFFGMSQTQKSYASVKDGKTVTYTQSEDVWYKEESEKPESVNFDIFGEAKSIEEVKDTEDKTYKITLTEDQIKQLMSTAGDATEDTESADIDLSNVTIEVSVKDGYITKITMKMPMEIKSEGQTSGVNATISFEFSKFNEVSGLSIPQDVIDKAIDQKEFEVRENVEDYLSEIEWALLGEDYTATTYTDTTLEYDGPKPTKVQLTIESGYIGSGVIEIEGYRATITDGKITDFAKID